MRNQLCDDSSAVKPVDLPSICGNEYTWVPSEVLADLGIRPERTQRFIIADGRQLKQQLGIAIVHAAGTDAPDLVVFAEPGDVVLMGARTLDGLDVAATLLQFQSKPSPWG